MTRAWPIAILVLAAPALALAAENGTTESGMAWLRKMAAASSHLNYSGTFVYRHGHTVETSRIVHYVDQAGGEFEKMETLDGPAREVIRTNDQVICYLPAAKTVLIEKRGKRGFPALVPEQLTGVTDNYTITVTGESSGLPAMNARSSCWCPRTRCATAIAFARRSIPDCRCTRVR